LIYMEHQKMNKQGSTSDIHSTASTHADKKAKYRREPKKPSLSEKLSKKLQISRKDPTKLYELMDRIGKGGYGSVFKARDIQTSEIVAVKIIKLEEDDESMLK